LSIYASTTATHTTGEAKTGSNHRIKHILAVYKFDGQIYFRELDKKNKRDFLFLYELVF
jgi:hypothetical protein